MSKKGTILILAAAVMWGTAGIFVRKLGGYGVGAMPIVVFRCLFTVIVIGIFMLARNRQEFSINPRDIPIFAANGIFSIIMFNFCYYKTMSLSTLSVAAILLYTAPIFVMIISVVFFKENLSIKRILALFLAFLGCLFVTGVLGSAVRISAEAFVYGLFTGLGYALYTIFGNKLILRGYRIMPIIFYTFLFALLGAGFIVVFSGQTGQLSFNFNTWLWAFLMAVFNTVLPYILYTSGLKLVNASVAPIIATVEPVAATVVGLFYGEGLTVFGIIGIALVLLSVVILNIKVGEKIGN